MCSDQPDALGLCFGRENDPLDLFSQFPQHGNNWRTGKHPLDFAKRYSEGEINLVAELASRTDNSIYHLVFFAIPNHCGNGGWIRRVGATSRNEALSGSRKKSASDWCQPSMEALPPDAVEANEKVVPSWIRLERAKQRHDLRREVFASSAYGVLELGGVIRYGELNKIEPLMLKTDRDSIGGLIQRGAKRFQRFVGNVSRPIGKLPPEFDLVRLANTIRVRLNHANVGLFFEKPLESGIECTDVVLCPAEPALRAIERAGVARHD